MKYVLYSFCIAALALLCSSQAFSPVSQNTGLVGAWTLEQVNGNSIQESGQRVVRIFSDTYTMEASYNIEEKTFGYASGGFYEFDGETAQIMLDYHSRDSEAVGTSSEGKVEFRDGKAHVSGKTPEGEDFSSVWARIDEGGTPLSGSWRISERMRDGEMVAMKRGPRKTIKILSGTRFQWAAMNTETKQFMGTGGGTYTLEDGRYVETIEFFSRDNSRVGMSLGFLGKVEDGAWHHSGKSSKGNPINEIWRQE